MAEQLWIPPGARNAAMFKKEPPPRTGDVFGPWAGRDNVYAVQMPGGAVLQFDLSRLTLNDFRMMRDHYQINASLTLLAFMMHGLDWKIECSSEKIRKAIEENLRRVWTPLVRSFCQSHWSGYGPTVMQWENNVGDRYTEITRFKDLIPEECRVNWKYVEGYAPPNHVKPKIAKYNGIRQMTSTFPIPVENTVWYPLLMENGDHYGRKLLKSAFPSWFFSQLIHLFVNRYFERFGEPLPVGRADFDATVNMGNGVTKSGRQAMEDILNAIRSRAVVVMPNDFTSINANGRPVYDYDISYLESQMRGADFERYLSRLDEEMSLALFTPVLLFRTADIGSHNLGVQHTRTWLWMLNALAGDWKYFIDNYIVKRMHDINFGVNAPEARWVHRQLGKENVQVLQAVATEAFRQGVAGADLDELGQAIGLTLHETQQLTEPPTKPTDPKPTNPTDKATRNPRARVGAGPRSTGQPRATTNRLLANIREQVEQAFAAGTFHMNFAPVLDYSLDFYDELLNEGWEPDEAGQTTIDFYRQANRWIADLVFASGFKDANDFIEQVELLLNAQVEGLSSAPTT